MGFGISWTISRANGNKNRVVITSDDFFGEAWNRLPDGKISFSQYTGENQEFLITPLATFTLSAIDYVDTYYAQVTAGSDYVITNSYTNNTSAAGMIINRVEDKDMHTTMEVPVLDLPKLGIAPEHYEAIETVVKELERRGYAIEIKY